MSQVRSSNLALTIISTQHIKSVELVAFDPSDQPGQPADLPSLLCLVQRLNAYTEATPNQLKIGNIFVCTVVARRESALSKQRF